ncbi:hypothetical protein QBC35DRAFT_509228 [Podospora australis]|uniref:Dehydrogenase n=1 Tax=Podospora australis TaxID=1536484 RepID=A0AAN6WJK6_9PEZI|nr:hypothetical protein QBC35DRAFT_509228 [Podospora australis]
MSDTSRLCSLVASKESLLDLLFMTAGFAPFGPRRETSEGIEVAAALEYYSRVLFMLHLLPLLRKSKGRVISVGGGGKEWKNSIFLDNLDLKKPENFKFWTVQRMYLGMTTVAMETLADQKENQGVTFIHSWPGIVSTGNVRRGLYEDETSWWAWFVHWVFEPFLTMIGFSEEECGERYLYQCVSARYGGKGVPWMGQKGVDSWEREGDEIEGQGGRLFLVDRKCECTPNAGVMKTLRGETKERVWDHTLKVLGPYL